MGDLMGNFGNSPEGQIARDKENKVESPPEGKVETGIEGVYADGINKRDNLPVFNVDSNEFHQNMSYGRQRIRFKSGSDAHKYMKSTRYKQSFWIQHTDKDGQKYMRKIK